MFDFVRKHTKIIMIFMFLLIIPAFVLVGVDGFRGVGGTGETVAKIGNHSITSTEWDAAHKDEVDRLRAQMPNLDSKLLDSPQARYAALERLVRERVLSQAVQDAHLNVTDTKLAQTLQQNPTLASLRGVDGKLDVERYRQIAAAQGLTPEGFEARVRTDMATRQVQTGISASAFTPTSVADVSLNAFFEQREVQVVRFNAKDYAAKVTLTDAEIDTFYQANPTLFQAPESANVEYVVLDLDAVKKTIVLNDSDLKTYYTQNIAQFNSVKEERRASHILINAPKDMASVDRKKARERAEALLLEVNKAPDSFAAVARKNSQDTGSGQQGGDLDYFVRGAMVKPFEEAVFSMRKGDISDVVESDFGFHIIKLTDIRMPKTPTFEEMRPKIESDLKLQQAQRKFVEVADAFTNGVYEQAESLAPIAERLKLDVKTASNVTRTPKLGTALVLSNPKLLSAIFNVDSVEKKRNTDAVEIAPNQLAAARIIEYTAARTRPLAEVRSQVQIRLVANRSAELAKTEATAKLTGWKSSSPATLPAAVVVSRNAMQGLQGKVIDALMRADTSALPVWVGVDLAELGYAIVRVNKVLAPAVSEPAVAKQQRDQFAQGFANAESEAYLDLLKARYKVQIKVPRPSGMSTTQE